MCHDFWQRNDKPGHHWSQIYIIMHMCYNNFVLYPFIISVKFEALQHELILYVRMIVSGYVYFIQLFLFLYRNYCRVIDASVVEVSIIMDIQQFKNVLLNAVMTYHSIGLKSKFYLQSLFLGSFEFA